MTSLASDAISTSTRIAETSDEAQMTNDRSKEKTEGAFARPRYLRVPQAAQKHTRRIPALYPLPSCRVT